MSQCTIAPVPEANEWIGRLRKSIARHALQVVQEFVEWDARQPLALALGQPVGQALVAQPHGDHQFARTVRAGLGGDDHRVGHERPARTPL